MRISRRPANNEWRLSFPAEIREAVDTVLAYFGVPIVTEVAGDEEGEVVLVFEAPDDVTDWFRRAYECETLELDDGWFVDLYTIKLDPRLSPRAFEGVVTHAEVGTKAKPEKWVIVRVVDSHNNYRLEVPADCALPVGTGVSVFGLVDGKGVMKKPQVAVLGRS